MDLSLRRLTPRLNLSLPRDPRWLQIGFLSLFLAFGLAARDFPLWHAPLIWASALGTQWVCLRVFKVREAARAQRGSAEASLAADLAIRNPSLRSREPWALGQSFWLSPVITCFGLTLLLRTDTWWVPPLAACIAIAGKFVLRVGDRHLFNPANLGVCAAMLLSQHAWSSPTQWGEGAATMLWFTALGLMVVHRSFRADTSLAFLASWSLLKLWRVWHLGQRAAVFEHQMASASLLLFTFFMISDPKTTPRTRTGRVVFAACVALVAFVFTHTLWMKSALLWALFVCAPLVPLIDHITARFTARIPARIAARLTARGAADPQLHAVPTFSQHAATSGN